MATQKNRKPFIFAAIGALNTVLDFGILFALKSFGLPAIAANTVSTSVAFIFSFVMNRKYTFKSSGQNVRRELVLFIAVTLFGLWVLQNTVIWLLTPVGLSFGWSDDTAVLVAKLVATGVSLVWNYIMYDKVVFKKSTD